MMTQKKEFNSLLPDDDLEDHLEDQISNSSVPSSTPELVKYAGVGFGSPIIRPMSVGW